MSPEPTGVHGLLKQRKLFTHKYVRKYDSGRIKEFEYEINDTFDKSKNLNEIIGLSDSQMLKTIRDVQNRVIDKNKLEILIKTRDMYRMALTYQQSKKGIKSATIIAAKLKKIKVKNEFTERLYRKQHFTTFSRLTTPIYKLLKGLFNGDIIF